MSITVLSLIIILILLLLWRTGIGFENYSNDMLQYATSGVPGVSMNLKVSALSSFLGLWIWRSEDNLREQILTINIVDEYFLQLQLTTNITSWYPPIRDSITNDINNSPWTSRKKTFVEKLPVYRVIVISDDEITISPINKTYAFSGPMHLRVHTGVLEYNGKIFNSAVTAR